MCCIGLQVQQNQLLHRPTSTTEPTCIQDQTKSFDLVTFDFVTSVVRALASFHVVCYCQESKRHLSSLPQLEGLEHMMREITEDTIEDRKSPEGDGPAAGELINFSWCTLL